MIVPETVTGTIFPFGGPKTFGVAERVITGGAVSAVLFNSTPTPFELEFATSRSGLLSPLTSEIARDFAPNPPELKLAAARKVASHGSERNSETPRAIASYRDSASTSTVCAECCWYR